MGLEDTNAADVIEVPAQSDIQPDDIQIAEPQSDSGSDSFDALFDEAAEAAAAQNEPEANDDEVDAEDAADDNPAEDDAETETETDAEQDKSEKNKSDEPKSEPDEKPSRVSKFKQLEAEREELQAKNTELETRQTELDKTFEKYGGVESVQDMAEVFDKVMNPQKVDQLVEELQKVPHGAKIQKAIFDHNLEMPENRVYAVNNVMKDDYGLEKSFSPETIDKVFQYISAKANEDSEDFENYLDRELSYLPPAEETETERLRRENELLKNPPKQQDQTADAQTYDLSKGDDLWRASQAAGKDLASYNSERFNDVAVPVLKELGYDKLAKVAENFVFGEINRQELETLQAAKAENGDIPFLPGQAMAELFMTKTAFGTEYADTTFGKQTKRAYDKVVKAKTEEFIKMISDALKPAGKAQTLPKPSGKTDNKSRAAVSGAINPKSSIQPGKREQSKTDVWGEDW